MIFNYVPLNVIHLRDQLIAKSCLWCSFKLGHNAHNSTQHEIRGKKKKREKGIQTYSCNVARKKTMEIPQDGRYLPTKWAAEFHEYHDYPYGEKATQAISLNHQLNV